VYTRDVGLAISLSNAISIEILLSFQIITAGVIDKPVLLSRLCKHHLSRGSVLPEHNTFTPVF
jgi:hypothetical protein